MGRLDQRLLASEGGVIPTSCSSAGALHGQRVATVAGQKLEVVASFMQAMLDE